MKKRRISGSKKNKESINGEMRMYNGKTCMGDCSQKVDEVRQFLKNWYEYDFRNSCYVCQECGHTIYR